MLDENDLHEKVDEAIKTGRLPLRRPDRQWGGKSVGGACSICGDLIDDDSMEFELEFDGHEPGAVVEHHVHIACYTAWERRIAMPSSAAPQAPRDLVTHRRLPVVMAEAERLLMRHEEGNMLACEHPAPDRRKQR